MNSPYTQPSSHFSSPSQSPSDEYFAQPYAHKAPRGEPLRAEPQRNYVGGLGRRVQAQLGRKVSTSNTEPMPVVRSLSGRSGMPIISASENGRERLEDLSAVDRYQQRYLSRHRAMPSRAGADAHGPAAVLRPPLVHSVSSEVVGQLGRGGMASHHPNQRPLARRLDAPLEEAAASMEQLAIGPSPAAPISPHYIPCPVAIPRTLGEAWERSEAVSDEITALRLQLQTCDYELRRIDRRLERLDREQEQLERRREQWARPLAAGRQAPDVPETVSESRAESPGPLVLPPQPRSAPSVGGAAPGGQGFGMLMLRRLPPEAVLSAPVTPADDSPDANMWRQFSWELGSPQSSSPHLPSAPSTGTSASRSQTERNSDQWRSNYEAHRRAELQRKAHLGFELRDRLNTRNTLRKWARAFCQMHAVANSEQHTPQI